MLNLREKPVQICTNCFFENFPWQVKQIRHINEWFKNNLKCRMISSDAHFAVLRKSVLVFIDLMKTACSNDEVVCSFRCIPLRRCSKPLNRICRSHLSIFMFCSLSVNSLCFMLSVFFIYLMKTAWYDQEDVCSSCFPHTRSQGLSG